MQNFEYYNPTRLIFGRGEIASLARHIPEGVRVLVTFGGGSVKRNGVYDQVKAALAGIDHVEFWGIEANPKVETLRKCIEFGREQKAGFILAVGGGSVLDGSKLVACALTEGETRDAWDIVLSRRPARCIPYASVMTLPATGSEMNANSVISRLETKEKLAFVAPENPRFSILDPECCRSLGAAQVAASLADITAHVLEQYMTEPGQSRPMDRWAEGLLLTLVDIAPALRAPEPDYDVLADYMLTATLGLNDMICMGVNQDWATHAIGHEITALTGMAHGATLAIVFPALLRVLIDTKEAKLVQMGERVFDVHYGTDRERALETIVRPSSPPSVCRPALTRQASVKTSNARSSAASRNATGSSASTRTSRPPRSPRSSPRPAPQRPEAEDPLQARSRGRLRGEQPKEEGRLQRFRAAGALFFFCCAAREGRAARLSIGLTCFWRLPGRRCGRRPEGRSGRCGRGGCRRGCRP